MAIVKSLIGSKDSALSDPFIDSGLELFAYEMMFVWELEDVTDFTCSC